MSNTPSVITLLGVVQASRNDLDDRDERESATEANATALESFERWHPVVIKLRCPRCNRVVEKLTPHGSDPVVIPVDGKLSERVANATPPPFDGVGAPLRLRFSCPGRRCTWAQTVRMEKLTAAWIRAARAGTRDMAL